MQKATTAEPVGNGRGWNSVWAMGRLGLFAVAFGCGTAAYRSHFNPEAPWWLWLLELALGCVALIVTIPAPSIAPARRALRWSAGIITLGAAAVATRLWPQPGQELAAGIATLVAMLAFFVARWVPFAASDLACLADTRTPAPATTATRVRQAALVLTSFGVAYASFRYNPTDHLAGFLLWLASLALFALAMWRRDPRDATATDWQQEAGPQLGNRSALFGLLLILVLAAALRMVALTEVPAWIYEDEGRQGRYSEKIWQDGFPDAFALGWNVFPHLAYMADYVGVQLLGTSNQSLRLTSATIGVLGIIPVFFWARRWWGNVIALIAVFLLAINREHIGWSRLGVNNIQQVLVATLMLSAFARAVRTQRAIDWVWLGFATGLAFHTYHAAKLFPALLIGTLILLAIGIRGFVRRSLPGAAAALVALLLCAGPILLTMYQQWDYFYSSTANRSEVHLLLDAYRAGDIAGVRTFLGTHVIGCLLSFISIPTPYRAFFDAYTVVPFLVGAGWMLWCWRDPRNLTVLAWTLGILVIGGMMTDYPPWMARLLGLIPTICVVPAIVAGRARQALFRWSPARADLIAAPLLVAWLGAALYQNWHVEFVQLPNQERGVILTEICRTIDRMPLPGTFYMVGGAVMAEPKVAANDCMIAPNPDRLYVNLPNDPAVVPLPPNHNGNAVIVVSFTQAELLPLIRQFYPDAHYEIVHDSIADPILHVFTLGQDMIEHARGLRAHFQSGARAWTEPNATSVFGAPPDNREFPLVADWSGLLYAPTPGDYRFRVSAGSLALDGAEIRSEQAHPLAAGWHTVRLRDTLTQATDHVNVAWRPPDSANWEALPRTYLNSTATTGGLLGHYAAPAREPSADMPAAEASAYSRIDPAISFDWYFHFDEPPPPAFAARPSTVEWTGTVDLEPGRWHQLRLDATTPTDVFLAGRLVAHANGAPSGEVVDVDIGELAGKIPIRIRTTRAANDRVDFWKLRLLWRTPAGDWSAVMPYQPSVFTD